MPRARGGPTARPGSGGTRFGERCGSPAWGPLGRPSCPVHRRRSPERPRPGYCAFAVSVSFRGDGIMDFRRLGRTLAQNLMPPRRILLVDDNKEFLDSAAHFLAGDPAIEIVGQASSGRCALEQVPLLKPDLV